VVDTSKGSPALRLNVTHAGMTVKIDVDGELQVVGVSVTDAGVDDHLATDRS
jgi:hypothetical protein